MGQDYIALRIVICEAATWRGKKTTTVRKQRAKFVQYMWPLCEPCKTQTHTTINAQKKLQQLRVGLMCIAILKKTVLCLPRL